MVVGHRTLSALVNELSIEDDQTPPPVVGKIGEFHLRFLEVSGGDDDATVVTFLARAERCRDGSPRMRTNSEGGTARDLLPEWETMLHGDGWSRPLERSAAGFRRGGADRLSHRRHRRRTAGPCSRACPQDPGGHRDRRGNRPRPERVAPSPFRTAPPRCRDRPPLVRSWPVTTARGAAGLRVRSAG